MFCLATLTVTPNWEIDAELLEFVHCLPQNPPLLAISEVRTDFGLVEGNAHLERRASETSLLESRWSVVVDATEEENSNGTLENGTEFGTFVGSDEGL